MKKDIPILKVEDLAIALVPRYNDINDELWDAFIINLKNEPIKSVLINSRGYGTIEGEKTKTSILRHFFKEINAKSFEQVEAVISSVFQLTNEFWVSFSYNDYLYDKKYIFVRGIVDENLITKIPIINRRGIMIR